MEDQNMNKNLPKDLKKKVENGGKLTKPEKDKFENEYGQYKNRSATNIIDLIHVVNRGKNIYFY